MDVRRFEKLLSKKGYGLTAVIHGVLTLAPSALAAGELPTTFSLSGTLLRHGSLTDTIEDSNVVIRVQILDPSKTCVLYDELKAERERGYARASRSHREFFG